MMNTPSPITLDSSSLPALQTGEPNWLPNSREQALNLFLTKGLPTKKLEDWKYSSLGVVTAETLLNMTDSVMPTISIDPTDQSVIHTSLRHLHQHPLIATKLTSVIQDSIEQNTPFNQQSLVALNSAYAEDIHILYVPASYQCNQPIEIHHPTANGTSYQHVVVLLEKNSQATLVEYFDHNSVTTEVQNQHHVNRIILQTGSELNHYRIQNTPDSCQHLYFQKTDIHPSANYQHFSFNHGSAFMHQTMYVDLLGAKSRCDIRGITLAKQNQHLDIHLPVTHHSPNAYSNQHFRSLVHHQAQSIFYGGIYVGKGCHKTEAHQLCKAMLLNAKAQAYLRPELDILTDDVICSHGATIGSLDPQALYYLQTRGLDEEEARILLTAAFLETLVSEIPLTAIQNQIRLSIEQWGA